MKTVERGPNSRDDVAKLLRAFAQALEDGGAIYVADREAAVPQTVDTKIKLSDKDGRKKLKISLSWPIGADIGGAEKQPVFNHFQPPVSVPSDFKQLKKELQHMLFYFRKRLDNGSFPSESELEIYRRLQEGFQAMSKPAWLDALAEVDKVTRDLLAACRGADRKGAYRQIDSLLALKAHYHGIYK